jgi:hypothetical protein
MCSEVSRGKIRRDTACADFFSIVKKFYAMPGKGSYQQKEALKKWRKFSAYRSIINQYNSRFWLPILPIPLNF